MYITHYELFLDYWTFHQIFQAHWLSFAVLIINYTSGSAR